MGGRTRKKAPKTKAKETGDKELKAILASIELLYNRNKDEINRIMDGSEQEIIVLGFSVTKDHSDIEPTIKTKLSFRESHTDSTSARLPDPDQDEFVFEGDGEQRELEGEPKPKKGRKKKDEQNGETTDEVTVGTDGAISEG